MNINEFVGQRKDDWQHLEEIAAKFKPGVTPKLTREELWELGKLYKGAVSDLALLQSSALFSDSENEVITYLSGLVTRVHSAIYRKHSRFEWRTLAHFLAAGFPQAFRAALAYNLMSISVFALFAVVGFVLGLSEQGFIELVVPDTIIGEVEKGRVWFKGLYAVAPMATSALISNNISVTFLLVASGISFGVGTFYLLALNGLLLGAAAAVCYLHNLSLEFWSFVLPHGSLELSAIIIAGGAGFIIGQALLDPGRYRRADSLAIRSQLAVRLALGCVPLIMLAGIIEAFFSPSPLPAWLKLVFASVSFSVLIIYLLTSGRNRADANTQGPFGAKL